MKVLIVDDQRINRTLPRVLLTQQGCAVLEAENGEDALAILATESVDAILLDVSMPGISGTDLCRQLRARADFAMVRIVAYTAHAMQSERADILAAGFDDILIKPITRQVLLEALKL